MAAYAVLALLAWRTLTVTVNVNGRAVPIAWLVYAILLMFALRTWVHERRLALDSRETGDAGERHQPM